MENVPSPNDQFQSVIVPVDKSLNETVSGENPEVTSALKSAVSEVEVMTVM